VPSSDGVEGVRRGERFLGTDDVNRRGDVSEIPTT
jgi:hypothetical protein